MYAFFFCGSLMTTNAIKCFKQLSNSALVPHSPPPPYHDNAPHEGQKQCVTALPSSHCSGA